MNISSKIPLKRFGISLFLLLVLSTIVPGLYNDLNSESLEQVINPKAAQNLWVSDMANIIDQNTENQINDLINQLEQKTTAEIAVVTIQETDGSTPKDFATELFKKWEIGKKGKDNGVLVLLVMGDRRIEVETGYGIEGVLPDGKVGKILDKYVIPYFREGNFGFGLLSGVKAISNILEGDASIQDSPAPKEQKKTGFSGIIKGLAVLFFIILALYLILKSRTQRCDKCHKKMRRLTEEQDDAYLAFGQKIEEELGSVDYQVWRCDDCQINKIKRRALLYKGYEDCPECKHRTLYVKSHNIIEPNYSREGLREITKICRFPKCTYQNIQKRVVPRLQRPQTRSSNSFSKGLFTGTVLGSGGSRGSSSSGGFSSGGSFGGGSSGGGGAGRSW